MQKLIQSIAVSATAMLFCLILSSCSSKQKLDVEVVNDSVVSFEAINPQDDALSEIQRTPTKFVLQYPDAQYSWDRAQLFFSQYTTQGRFIAGKGNSLKLSNQGSEKDVMRYEVERSDTKSGVQFNLGCYSKNGSTYDAELNCKNLARFMRNGTLELSLLK